MDTGQLSNSGTHHELCTRTNFSRRTMDRLFGLVSTESCCPLMDTICGLTNM